MSKETVETPVETQIVITVPPFIVKSTSFVKRHASKALWFVGGAVAGATALYLTASSDDDELEDDDEQELLDQANDLMELES